MANTSYETYLEEEVLSADPMKLVRLLYRGATEATRAARQYLASGAIRERSNQIMKAWRILDELIQSLDRQRGGEISPALASLYTYMKTRLMEANSRQADAPLAEVEALLGTLSEAWGSLEPPPAEPTNYQPISCSY